MRERKPEASQTGIADTRLSAHTPRRFAMKAPYASTQFGETADAAFVQAQKDLQARTGYHPTEYVLLQHPERFSPTKFYERLTTSLANGTKLRGISARHNDLVAQATDVIKAGKAVAFELHGGNAKNARDAAGAKRRQGEAMI